MRNINWAEFYKAFSPELLGVCRRYINNIGDAEDIVQNTFEVAMLKVGTYSGKGSFKGWVKRIAINQCIQFLRDQKKSINVITEYNENLIVGMNGEDRYGLFNSRELLDVIDQLPEHHKTVFNLYVLDGYKHHQIAEMLDISSGTSKSHLARARKKAKSILLAKAKQKEYSETRYKCWILLLFLRFNMVDWVFKKGFSNYKIKSGKLKLSFSDSLNSSVTTGISTGAKILIAVGFGVFVIAGVVLCNKHRDTTTDMSNEIIATTLKDSLFIEKLDTSSVLKEEVIIEPIQQEKPKPKVLVRKKVIVRDTVYVPK